MANAHAPDTSHYYVPHDSPWPIRGSVALFALMLGAISYFNDWAGGWSFAPGVVLLAYMFFGWFSTVIGENQHGIYNDQVDRSFRMGMMWFIFSEVMFFAAFFGALFYARTLRSCRFHVRDDCRHRPPGHQHSDPAHQRTHDYHCPPCAPRRETGHPDGVPGADFPAGIHFRGPAGA